MKQGVGSTISWKPVSFNCKSHTKKKKVNVKHFIENCNDNGFNNLRFTIADCLNNVDSLPRDEIDDLFLEKEMFWLRTLIT